MRMSRLVVLAVLALMVVLAMGAQAAYKGDWKYQPADLSGTSNLCDAVDDLDGRLDALGIESATDELDLPSASIDEVELGDGGATFSSDGGGTNATVTLQQRSDGSIIVQLGGTTNVNGDTFQIDIVGHDLWGTNVTYMSIDLTLDDTASGSMDSTAVIKTMVAGSESARLTLNAAGLLVAGNLVTGGGAYTGLTEVVTNAYTGGTGTNVWTLVDGRVMSLTTDP